MISRPGSTSVQSWSTYHVDTSLNKMFPFEAGATTKSEARNTEAGAMTQSPPRGGYGRPPVSTGRNGRKCRPRRGTKGCREAVAGPPGVGSLHDRLRLVGVVAGEGN